MSIANIKQFINDKAVEFGAKPELDPGVNRDGYLYRSSGPLGCWPGHGDA